MSDRSVWWSASGQCIADDAPNRERALVASAIAIDNNPDMRRSSPRYVVCGRATVVIVDVAVRLGQVDRKRLKFTDVR